MTIIRTFEYTEEKKGISKKMLIPAAIFLFFLLLTQIWINNTFVSYGEKLQSISILENTLKMENQLIENEVSRYSALSKVASESASLGFSQAENIQYIQ